MIQIINSEFRIAIITMLKKTKKIMVIINLKKHTLEISAKK